MTVYLNGQFLPKDAARISPDDRGFLFADGVYEVVRVYDGRLFRAKEHWQRLARSLDALKIRGADNVDFQTISETLLDRNQLRSGDAIIYLQITRGVAPRKHYFPDPAVPPTVYGYAAPFDPPRAKWDAGIKVITTSDIRWMRCDIKTVSLLPNALAAQQAREQGADEALFIRDGALTEGSHSNCAAVVRGELVTYPLCHYILGGISRDAVLELCRKLKITVREVPVLEPELRSVDELMLLGTTTEVMPVVQVNDWRVGNGKPGPVTRRLQQAFRDLVAAEK